MYKLTVVSADVYEWDEDNGQGVYIHSFDIGVAYTRETVKDVLMAFIENETSVTSEDLDKELYYLVADYNDGSNIYMQIVDNENIPDDNGHFISDLSFRIEQVLPVEKIEL